MSNAEAYEITASWHDRQARLFQIMADDEPRVSATNRARAKEAAVHHAGSAASLRSIASNLRRAALAKSTGGDDGA